MGIFVRTIIITLILSAFYHFWIKGASFNLPNINMKMPDINVEAPKINKNKPKEDLKVQNNSPYRRIEATKKVVKICFIDSKGNFKYANREVSEPNVKNLIEMLLRGPNSAEKKSGLYSEIPTDTVLYWVREDNGEIIVNLSNNFAEGGGTSSVLARIEQLKNTVKRFRPEFPVYLYLNGKKAEYIGGEGVYLKQPLN